MADKQVRPWYDVAKSYSENLGPDLEREATNYLLGQYQSYKDPIGTISNVGSHLYDLGTGLVSKGVDALGYPTTGDIKYHREQALDDTLQSLKDKFGSVAGFQDYVSEHPVQATGTVLGALTGAGGLARKAMTSPELGRLIADESGALRLWHGSPHDFDKFDLSKIDTGEGAQAYGHGLYFAENPDIAKSYRDNLSRGNPDVAYKGKPLPVYTGVPTNVSGLTPEEHYASKFGYQKDIEFAKNEEIKDLEKSKLRIVNDKDLSPDRKEKILKSIEEEIAAIQSVDSNKIEKLPKGRLYEVNINAEPEQFLDWDKPVNELQAEDLYDAFVGSMNPEHDELALLLRHAPHGGLTGKDVYNWIGNTIDKGHVPEGVFVGPSKDASKLTTEYLRDANIPGIKYLDQGSRLSGQGSHNYVIFDDKLIDILNKYADGGAVSEDELGNLYDASGKMLPKPQSSEHQFTRGLIPEEDLAPSQSRTENFLRLFSPIRMANAFLPVGHDEHGNISPAVPSVIADPASSWVNMVERHKAGIDDPEADVIDSFTVGSSAGLGGLAATPMKPVGTIGTMGGRRLVPKELPMDPASRLARAKEMGFDTETPLYHGTHADFPEFSLKPNPDRDIFGIHLGTKEQAEDIVRNHHHVARNKLGEWSENGKVLPVYAKSENLLELPDLGKSNAWDIGQLQYEMAERNIPFKGDIFNPSYEDIRRSLQEAGYDGIKYVNNFEGVKAHGPQQSVMLFDPKNIRSVNAAFDPAKSDSANLLAANAKSAAAIPLALSTVEKNELPRLAALHNVSPEKLRFAENLGGIPVPSVAVVKEGMGLEGFGDISLIGRKSLADPSENPVFSSDAYSMRQPRPLYKPVKSGLADKLVFEEMKPFVNKFEDTSSANAIYESLRDKPNLDQAIYKMQQSPAAQAMFLKEKGIDFEPVMRSAMYGSRYPWVDTKAFKKFIKDNGNNWRSSEFLDNPENQKIYDAAVSDAIEEYANKQIKRKKKNPETEDLKQQIISAYKERIPGNPFNLEDDVKRLGKEVVDASKTQDLIKEPLSQYKNEFDSWVKNKITPLYQDPYVELGRRKAPYTLDNLVEAMTKGSKVQGQEQTMTYGPGKAKAETATKFADLQHMRNLASWKLEPEAKIENLVKQSEDAIDKFQNAVLPYYKYSDTWRSLDNTMRSISAITKKSNLTPQALRKELSKYDFVNVPNDVLQLGIDAAKTFGEVPATYFESKPQRAVQLKEFAGAVVPKTVPQDVLDILKKHNIPYETYENVAKDSQTLATANFVKKLSEKEKDVLFSNAMGLPPLYSGNSDENKVKPLRGGFGPKYDEHGNPKDLPRLRPQN